MITDRELLELAAKAAGYTTNHPWNAERLTMNPPVDALVVQDANGLVYTAWNPLTDDGAALKAAVSEAVAEERMACAELMEQQHTWITNVAASALIRARGTP